MWKMCEIFLITLTMLFFVLRESWRYFIYNKNYKNYKNYKNNYNKNV